MRKLLKENVLYLALFIALVSTAGSLYFSEIKHFLPCILCWYQRICMYPLIIILIVGILRSDKGIVWYSLPFSIIGMLIAIFHNLLYYNIIPEAAVPCRAGISCTTKYISWLGFITIPLLSLTAFALITLCILIFAKLQKR